MKNICVWIKGNMMTNKEKTYDNLWLI